MARPTGNGSKSPKPINDEPVKNPEGDTMQDQMTFAEAVEMVAREHGTDPAEVWAGIERALGSEADTLRDQLAAEREEARSS